MNIQTEIVLAIESAISGGSLSLLVNGTEVDYWIGSADLSRAEDLLSNISELLGQNDMSLSQLDMIAVSAGPGSFTGIRIGLATALGLAKGLGVQMSSISALKAMAAAAAPDKIVIAAVPAGRSSVCFQSFDGGSPINEPAAVAESTFAELVLDKKRDVLYIVHTSLLRFLDRTPNVLDAGTNIAKAVGNLSRENHGVVTEPIFISKG